MKGSLTVEFRLSAIAPDIPGERVTQVKPDQCRRNRDLGGIVPFDFRVGYAINHCLEYS